MISLCINDFFLKGYVMVMTNKPWDEQPGDVKQSFGWIKSKDGYEGYEDLGFDIDPKQVIVPSEDEWNRLLAQERELRMPLKRLPAHLETPKKIADLAVEAGLDETLKQWAHFHVLNITISMKKGNDVMVIPASLTLLQAAKILLERK